MKARPNTLMSTRLSPLIQMSLLPSLLEVMLELMILQSMLPMPLLNLTQTSPLLVVMSAMMMVWLPAGIHGICSLTCLRILAPNWAGSCQLLLALETMMWDLTQIQQSSLTQTTFPYISSISPSIWSQQVIVTDRDLQVFQQLSQIWLKEEHTLVTLLEEQFSSH